MKLDIKKQTHTVYNNYLGLPFEMQLLKATSKARVAWGTFQPRIQQGEKRKRSIQSRISNFDNGRISQPKIQ